MTDQAEATGLAGLATYEGLLLDVGGVILDPWQALDAYGVTIGRTFPARGPHDPDEDALWRDVLAGLLTLDDYWQRVALAADHVGWREMFREITELVPDALFDPGATALMRDATAAGRRVGVLSNDAYAIRSPEFYAGRPEFAGLDAFVDATDLGIGKPEPGAYLAAAAALGLPPESVVFLDDLPENVDGARAVGMGAIRVTPGDAATAFRATRVLLGLPS
jgi:putative hydrolase of the HAD superfamily